MNPIQKIRTSFSTQLTLWVTGFVLVISAVVLFLLARFSLEVIHDESIETTLQALENTALRIDNTLRQAEITARLEHKRQRINRTGIEQLIKENGYLESLQQSLPNAKLYVTRRDTSQLAVYFSGNESGYRQMIYEGKEIYIFTQPVGERQYNLAVVCPTSDIYKPYLGVQNYLLLRYAIAMIFLLGILYVVVGIHLRPLHKLADTAQSIADGQLDAPIQDAHHQDEIGRLQNSLKTMQTSLVSYMDEMRQKHEELSRHNSELQAAYNEAQDYEKQKSKFLYDMTNRMAGPVYQVCRCTDNVCHDYSKLTIDEMIQLQADIMKASETITGLLERLTKDYVAL